MQAASTEPANSGDKKMTSVTFILDHKLYSIATPSMHTAIMLWYILKNAGVPARAWTHQAKNSPSLLAS